MAISDDNKRLMDNARMRLPGALDSVILMELFNVVDDFMKGSNAWFDVVPLAVNAGDTSLAVATGQDAQIVRLLGVEDDQGFPVKASMPSIGQIKLFAAPSTDMTINVSLGLTVQSKDADGFPVYPDWFVALYGSELLEGVLSRMMSQPAKPYYNPALAKFHADRFAVAIAEARFANLKENTYGAQPWRFPQSFNRRKVG